MTQVKKGLSLFALTMVAIGATIGSGIFQTPGTIASEVPVPWIIIGLWVLGGLVSLIGSLVFAELGSRFPKAGGVYTYLNEAYGPLPAFLYGWCLLTVVSSGTIAALVVVFANYVNYFLHLGSDSTIWIAGVAVAVLTLFNTFGIKSSEWFANISTVLKIVGIYALLFLALFLGDKVIFTSAHEAVAGAAEPASPAMSNIAVAFVGVLWSYLGWHYASFVAGDAVNPKRNVPLAMIFGTTAVTLTYVLVNMGYMKALDLHTIQTSDALAATALETVLPGSGNWVAILISVSVFGCAGMYVLSTPRVVQQMAVQGLFFSFLKKSHPRFGVPLNAIVLQSIWAIVLVFLWQKFEALYTYVTVTECFFLMLACFGIYLVRRKNSGEQSGFRTPLYPVLPALFVIIIAWFVYSNAVTDNPAAYYGLLVIPIGFIFYYVFRRFSRP